VLEDGADGGLGERVVLVIGEDAAEGDCLGDGAGGGEAAEVYEEAEALFGGVFIWRFWMVR